MTLQQLKHLINTHSIISFDVYDTLIMRKVLHPYDVFKIIGETKAKKLNFDFFSERRRAEVELRDYTDPDLYDIYSQMQQNTGMNDQTLQMLLDSEIEFEKNISVPRQCIVDLFNEIKKQKRVYLISDMHLPYQTIKDILTHAGIVGYEELILSNVYRTCKKHDLYRKYLDIVGQEACLHIGDNYKTDFLKPTEYGIDTFWIPSAYEIFSRKNTEFVEPTSMPQRCILSEKIINEYQNPFDNI